MNYFYKLSTEIEVLWKLPNVLFIIFMQTRFLTKEKVTYRPYIYTIYSKIKIPKRNAI